MTDDELAAHLAEGAGRLLLDLRNNHFLEANVLGKEGDMVANSFILTALQEWRPQDGVLSEESADSPDRLGKDRVWIIDPLDGTREYSEGREDWAVHVALAIGGRPAAGAVAVPALGRLFRTHPPHAASAPVRARPIMLVSRTRPPAEADEIAAILDAEIVAAGSAGAKAMAVVAGEADIYFHSGGQHEWDNCAPAAVALAAGLHVSRADGSPLRYNQACTSVPDLVIARSDLGAKITGFFSSSARTIARK